jgi:hypothetical protein
MRFNDLKAELAQFLDRLQGILNKDLPGFNDLVHAKGIQPIMLPEKKKIKGGQLEKKFHFWIISVFGRSSDSGHGKSRKTQEPLDDHLLRGRLQFL